MFRRILDLSLAILLLFLLAPLLLTIAILIYVTDGRPIIYRQHRVGFGGMPFNVHKFRTMRNSVEKTGSLTFRSDPRVTRLGKVLRATKLDEFPQLINIIRGEMSFVGPRPEVLDWAATFSPEEREVFNRLPGLTDPVQLLFRHEHEYLEDDEQYRKLLRIKVRKQIEYSRNRNLRSDLRVLIQTPFAIARRRPEPLELDIYRQVGCKKALE